MTDRELLEAAANAAGIELIVWGTPGAENFADKADHGRRWNPLTDDGDALRLAVRLKIDIKHYEDQVVCWYDQFFGTGRIMYGADKFAATRRAIVRASASLVDK